MSEASTDQSMQLSRAVRSPAFLAIVAGSCVVAWLVLLMSRATGIATGGGPAPTTTATAIENASPSKGFECRWTDAAVVIDGDAGDLAWAHAQTVERFYLPWLGEHARDARTPTRARLLWDRQYLYFIAEMEDGDLHAPVAEHDGKLWEHDVFELFFKPARDKPGYYEFEVNPANAVLDLFLPSRESANYARYKSDGEFDVKTAVKLRGTLNRREDTDAGWTVEGRIAWKSLLRTGGRPEPGEAWSFALCRVDDSVSLETPELSTSAPLAASGKPDFHRVDQYAPIVLVGPPDPPPTHRVVNAYPKLKLSHPIAIDRQPNSDRILAITEGAPYGATRIVRFVDDPGVSKIEELLELDAIAVDFAFHPDFARNGYVYVGLNGPHSGKNKKSKVVRYTIDRKAPYALDPTSATTIIEWESEGHNGGALDFGPDGMLYTTSGDGTSDSDTWLSGQDLSRLLAKVLRIDVNQPDPGRR